MKQKMSKECKVACILTSIAFLVLCTIGPINFFFHNHYSLKEWEKGNFSKEKDLIPSKEECNGYKKAKYYWNDNRMGSWVWGYAQAALCLELQYEETTYIAAKEKALSSYHFLEEPVLVPDSLKKEKIFYRMPLTETTLGDFTVKIVDDRKYPESPLAYVKDEETGEVIKNGNYTDFPDYFGFLAFNDEDHKIRYCHLLDYELDEFKDEKTLQGYLKRNFPLGWK